MAILFYTKSITGLLDSSDRVRMSGYESTLQLRLHHPRLRGDGAADHAVPLKCMLHQLKPKQSPYLLLSLDLLNNLPLYGIYLRISTPINKFSKLALLRIIILQHFDWSKIRLFNLLNNLPFPFLKREGDC